MWSFTHFLNIWFLVISYLPHQRHCSVHFGNTTSCILQKIKGFLHVFHSKVKRLAVQCLFTYIYTHTQLHISNKLPVLFHFLIELDHLHSELLIRAHNWYYVTAPCAPPSPAPASLSIWKTRQTAGSLWRHSLSVFRGSGRVVSWALPASQPARLVGAQAKRLSFWKSVNSWLIPSRYGFRRFV